MQEDGFEIGPLQRDIEDLQSVAAGSIEKGGDFGGLFDGAVDCGVLRCSAVRGSPGAEVCLMTVEVHGDGTAGAEGLCD